MQARAHRILLGLGCAVALGLGVLPVSADTLLLPDAKNGSVVDVPYTRVTVWGDGRVEHGGRALGAGTEAPAPTLVESFRAWHSGSPTGLVLVAGDRRADFRAVRGVLSGASEAGVREVAFLTAPEETPPRALRVAQRVLPFDPLAEPEKGPRLVQLSVRLAASQLVFGREPADAVVVPRVDGRLDSVRLSALLDEDRRLHPSARFVILTTDDGVAYADLVEALDLTRGKGYTRTLLAGGPPAPITAPAAPLWLDAPVARFESVHLRANGDADLHAADGSTDIVRHATVTGYEAHCDATACDIVLRTADRRLALGAHVLEGRFPDALFGRPLHRYDGRLGLPEPVREGVFSPLVALPGQDPAGDDAASGIVLGTLDKALIDEVMRRNMGHVQACYQELLERLPTSSGKLTTK